MLMVQVISVYSRLLSTTTAAKSGERDATALCTFSSHALTAEELVDETLMVLRVARYISSNIVMS